MNDAVVATTNIPGLRWEANEVRRDQLCQRVAVSTGPGVSDFVTHASDFRYNQFGIHVGQDDRLTFFGPAKQTIVGCFVDCRRGSPTLHEQERLIFHPDPRRKLVIERGVAHTFDGLENILTRDEPLWHLALNNPDYNMANDVVNFRRDESPSRYPVVTPNDLPIPRECYDFVTTTQHRLLDEDVPVYPIRFQAQLHGRTRYVVATPKPGGAQMSTKRAAIKKTLIKGLEWRPNYVAQSGPRSYYVIANPGSTLTDLLFYPKVTGASWYGVHLGQVDRLTFFGDARTQIEGRFVDCRRGSRTLHRTVRMSFRPDPTRHLHIDVGIAHAFSGLRNVTVRVECLWLMSADNPDFDLANDTVNFRVDEPKKGWPVLRVNDLPVPTEVLEYVVQQQRQAIEHGGMDRFATRAAIAGEIQRVSVVPKR